MTVIAAVRVPELGKVVLAADSMSYDTGGTVWPAPWKLFERQTNGPTKVLDDGLSKPEPGHRFILGSTGTTASAAAMRFDLRMPDPPAFYLDDQQSVEPGAEAELDRWAHDVAVGFSELCKGRGLIDKDAEGGPDSSAGWCLMALGSRLWELSNYCAHPVDTYAAIGSGGPVALGALHAEMHRFSYRFGDDGPTLPTTIEQAVNYASNAVAAACHWSMTCGLPCTTLVS